MKLKIYTLLLALSVTWSLQSCDNDDDGSIAVPAELQSAFSSKFPNAANVKWETKSGYYVADVYKRQICSFIILHYYHFRMGILPEYATALCTSTLAGRLSNRKKK